MKSFPLIISFSFFLMSKPVFSKDQTTLSNSIRDKITSAIKTAAKYSAAATLALGGHYVLEFISTYAHEHGHGIASQQNYSVTMIPNNNILQPWYGFTSWPRHRRNSWQNESFELAAGPLTGIFTTYIQSIALTMFKSYMDNKSLRTGFYAGLKSPITFFTNAIKKGEKYTSLIFEGSTRDNESTDTKILSLSTEMLLFLRMGRMIGESIYGLLPYHDSSTLVMDVGGGDGEKIWKLLLGAGVPTFTGNLSSITLGIMAIPYLIGAAKAINEKFRKSNHTETPNNPLSSIDSANIQNEE